MILVTGATGTVGSEVVNLLLASGKQVLAVTRHPETAALPGGVHVLGADASHPQTLKSVLRGVEAIFISPRALGDATAGAATAELLRLAAEQGTRRVVAISAVTVQSGGGYQHFADAFKAVEDEVRASNMSWTILRCADFASNALSWAPQIRATGVVWGVYGEGKTSTIHNRDIAAVSVRGLVDNLHAGRTYVLTGSQLLSQRDRVRLIGQAIGTTLSWEEVPPEQYRQAMLAQGLPEDVPERVIGYWSSLAEHPMLLTNTVEQVLGRPALTFAEWATEHAATFRR